MGFSTSTHGTNSEEADVHLQTFQVMDHDGYWEVLHQRSGCDGRWVSHRVFIKEYIAERLHLTVIKKTRILANTFLQARLWNMIATSFTYDCVVSMTTQKP